jgi:hypothetical protein
MKKATQIKTYHGIPVPPWRHEVVKKSMTLVFIVTGRIPSKKNELVAVVDRVDAFKYLATISGPTITKKEAVTMVFKTFGRIKNAVAYEQWEAATVDIFREQQKVFQSAAHRNGIVFPLSKATVSTKFYWKGKYRRDNSNKSEGLHDALVKAQILLDDSDRVIADTAQSARDYSEEVIQSMAVIYITVPIK